MMKTDGHEAPRYKPEDIERIYLRMAEKGTAPEDYCNLFGVGFSDVFAVLEREYLERTFRLAASSEKFLVGAYGSGKTHFLRHFSQIARHRTCVTSEVQLNKSIDYTRYLTVFQEIARDIRPPRGDGRGITALLRASATRLAKVLAKKHGQEVGDDEGRWVRPWCKELNLDSFESPSYARALQRGLEAVVDRDEDSLQGLSRWLSGFFNDRPLCKQFNLTYVEKADQSRQASQALLALGQFIRAVGFRGTLVAFDEAEQGLDVDRKRFDRILSLLQSTINDVADLQGGALLLMWAFTPELLDRFNEFPALQQRISSPTPFLQNNPRAPVIPLERGRPREDELREISTSLATLCFHVNEVPTEVQQSVLQECLAEASTIARQDPGISSRRTVVKATCTRLLALWGPQTGRDDFEDDIDDDDEV